MTIVFDLDETLIHVSKNIEGASYKIPIKMKNGQIVKVINIRFNPLAWSSFPTLPY